MDMQMNFIRKLPTPKEVKEMFPLNESISTSIFIISPLPVNTVSFHT